MPILDKLPLKRFNRLSYNSEISEPLVASFLFNLLDNYISYIISFKTININIL